MKGGATPAPEFAPEESENSEIFFFFLSDFSEVKRNFLSFPQERERSEGIRSVLNDPALQPTLFFYDVLNLSEMKELWSLYLVFSPPDFLISKPARV